DPPLVSSQAVGIPKPTLTNPPVPEVVPMSAALPIWGTAFWCVWAAYATAEIPEPSMPAEGSPEVVTEAAEPPEMAVPAPDPPEAVPFMSVLLKEVVPIYELLSCPVPVTEATYELSACPVTAMEAVTELSAPSVLAKDIDYELLPMFDLTLSMTTSLFVQ
ncbi:hypothetical protein M9458_011490, partial [Cirrhinus mrigala]